MGNEKFEVYFWQNSISPHQSYFIRHLSENKQFEVFWIAAKDLGKERKGMGWQVPETGEAHILVNPELDEVDNILVTSDPANSIHIFSGPRGIPIIFAAFRRAIHLKRKVALMAETYNWMGWSGKLRFLRGVIDRIRFGNHIRIILSIGYQSKMWFKKVGFSEKKIIDWAYALSHLITP